LPWLDAPLDVRVNIADACNAFSTGDSVHFYQASAECQNTARVADIVYHELGHSFHNQSIIPGAGGFEASMVEGIADFFAANITNDSGIGRGLHFDDAAVRELDPEGGERVYPRDLSLVSHTTGLIIGGTLWDLRTQLVAKHGVAQGITATEKIFLGIMQRAGDLTMAYQAALVADDDDGNLANGTPNRCIIESAFGRHGLAGTELRETSLSAPVVDGGTVSVSVVTPATTTCPPARATAVTLRWRMRGDSTLAAIPMTAAGATWSAALPEVPDGSVLEYQVVAALDTSETLHLPDNPADPYYQLFVGDATELWCERFDADPRWMQDGDIEWEVAMASAASVRAGDPPTAAAGGTWLGTSLRGEGRYRADILTKITSPSVDATGWGSVHLQFRRWLVIEDAKLDVATVRVNGQQVWANASNESASLDHVDKEWRFVDFDITPHASAPVSVAWTLASDARRQLGGWNLDEICIVARDKQPRCGDGIVDEGEDCDGSDDCSDTCEAPGGGCCSSSDDAAASSLVLALLVGLGQFVMIFVRRR